MLQTIGARVRWLREAAGLSARRMSVLMSGDPDKSRRYIGMIERETRRPGRETLASIAALFGVSLDWLVLGKGDAPNVRDVRAAALDRAA